MNANRPFLKEFKKGCTGQDVKYVQSFSNRQIQISGLTVLCKNLA